MGSNVVLISLYFNIEVNRCVKVGNKTANINVKHRSL